MQCLAYACCRYEVDKLTASQRLDLNLEKGRMRDELQASAGMFPCLAQTSAGRRDHVIFRLSIGPAHIAGAPGQGQ